MNKRKGLSSQGFLPWWITVPVFLIVCGSLFVNLVQYQVSIASKQQELQSVQNQLSTQLTENAELSGTLDQGESAIIERYAREQGKAYKDITVIVAHLGGGITVNLHHNGRIEDCFNDEGRSLPSVPAVCPCTT